MKKWWNNLKDQPMTWGDYFGFAKWCMVISAIIAAIEVCYIWWDEISAKVSSVVEKFKPKSSFKFDAYEDDWQETN